MSVLVKWFNGLGAPQAALLGAVIGGVLGALANITTGLLRDFAATAWTEKRGSKKLADDVFRRYAEPLSSVMTSLMWRLHEILAGEGRASFLMAVEPKTEFDDYKLLSTYYRVAATLGWIRALRRELSFLRSQGGPSKNNVEGAIGEFEASLADGHHVELQRLHGLSKLWDLPFVSGQSEKQIGVSVDRCIRSALESVPVHAAVDLATDAQEKLCTEVAGVMFSAAGLESLSQSKLTETRGEAVRLFSIREAWLFRDWQGAIGDLMIRETTVGNRRFEVIGFGEFESMILDPSPAQLRSLRRIAALFDRLDIASKDTVDARPETIRKLYIATAGVLVSLSKSQTKLVDDKTSRLANRIIAEQYNRRS